MSIVNTDRVRQDREAPHVTDTRLAREPTEAAPGTWRRLRGLGILVVGRLSIVLAAVVSVRLMTTLLSPREVGRYTVLIAFTMWFSLTLISPVGNYVNRRFLEWVSAGTLWRELRRYSALLTLIVCIAGSALVLARDAGLLGLSIGVGPLIVCVTGTLVFLTVNTMLVAFLNVLGHRTAYVVCTSATTWLGLGFSVVLILGFGHAAEPWIVGQVVGWAVIAVVGFVALRRNVVRARLDPAVLVSQQQRLWTFVWPLVISTSLYWFQVQGYRIELEHWVGVSAVGLLTTGLMLGSNPIVIIDTLLGEYLRPGYYRAIASGDRAAQEAAWSAMAGAFIALLIPVAVLVGLSGSFITVLLVSSSFGSVAGLVGWGVLTEFLRALNNLYVLAAHTRFQTRVMLRPAIFGAVIVLVAIVPLARWNLDVGAGLALSLGMAGSTLYLAHSLRPVFTTRLPVREIIRALVCTAPLGLGLVAAHLVLKHPSPLQAVVVLACAGLVTICIQVLVARPWLSMTTRVSRVAA